MNRIILFLIVCSFGFNSSYAQKKLNDYKYVIVPNSYSLFDAPDKYRLNSLTKFLFKKHGFEAMMEDEPYPEDLTNDACLALRANLIEHNSMFKTKVEVQLRDCSNNLVYKTKIGETRVKEYKSAYNLAVREAFTSFDGVEYKYTGKTLKVSVESSEPKITNVKIEPVKKIEEVKPEKPATLKKINKVVKGEKVKKSNKKEKIKETKRLMASNNVLYAQAIDNGFQIVDSTPKVVMILLESGKSDTYIVKGKDAIVYEEDGFWYMSESINDSIKTKRLNIKF